MIDPTAEAGAAPKTTAEMIRAIQPFERITFLIGSRLQTQIV